MTYFIIRGKTHTGSGLYSTGLENKVSQDWLLGALSDKLPWMLKARESKNLILVMVAIN